MRARDQNGDARVVSRLNRSDTVAILAEAARGLVWMMSNLIRNGVPAQGRARVAVDRVPSPWLEVWASYQAYSDVSFRPPASVGYNFVFVISRMMRIEFGMCLVL